MRTSPRPTSARTPNDVGAAMASAMFALVLMAGLTAGLTALVITDTKVRTLDSTRTQAFYVAHAGLENLTAALGNLFDSNYAPSGAQINALVTTPPAGLNATWLKPDGTSGYTITFPHDGTGNPTSSVMTVLSGPFQGLVGLATPYQMAVTARIADGSEASLTRTLQTVSIPVFQFGLFSDNDLSFFAGPAFNFGGRVHTNSNLYLASGDGTTLTLSDKVTAVGDIIRTNLSNGWNLNTNYNGTVNAITAPNAFRALAKTEGSLVGTVGSAANPQWSNLSTGTYNHNITSGSTGAKRLDLPIAQFGATPIDLIRRPVQNEDTANPLVFNERYYSMASVRILLSDNAADITSLPRSAGVAPLPLGTVAPGTAGQYTGPALGVTPGVNTGAAATSAKYGVRVANTPQLGGFIRIEKQTPAGVWQDVTMEILNLGIADKEWGCANDTNYTAAASQGKAIILLERPRDNNGCLAAPVANTDYSANALYDPREGVYRDSAATNSSVTLGGVMFYVGLDVNNLRRWLLGQIGASGTNTMNVTGYVVYFSDRRGNHTGLINVSNTETAEFGFEDIVNPASGAGTPNGVLNTGEDFNGNGTLETYGGTPLASPTAPGGGSQAWGNYSAPFASTIKPYTALDVSNTAISAAIARRNPPVFFRRALKLQNGGIAGGVNNIPSPGLTVVAENPVYIQGNWNASTAGFVDPHVATAVIADAVTLLSNDWDDRNSFNGPQDLSQRVVTNNTYYRVAVIAGKGISFPQPAGTGQDYGTDGGAHNFLRYIENWGTKSPQLNYKGSIVSMFTSRQATGTFKCCNVVYSPPTRGYNFDVDFLTPALLPPRTPMFRDVNTTGFAQIIRPGG